MTAIASGFPPLRAVIFDLDGTLMNTEAALDACIVRAIRALLDRDTPHEALDHVRGLPDHGPESWPVRMLAFLGAPPTVTPAALFAESDRHFEAMIQTSPKMPGAGETVAALQAARVPMALATSSMRHHVALKRLRHEAMFAALSHLVCVEDVAPLAKPHPRPYELAAELLGLRPSECVAVEDSEPGIRAAVAAGCFVVATPLPRLRDAARALGAHVVLDSLLEWEERVAPLLAGAGAGAEGGAGAAPTA